MADQPIQLVQPQPPPRGPLAFWSALDPAVKATLQFAALVAVLAAGLQTYNAIVTEGELAVVRTAQAGVDERQTAAIAEVGEDADLLFQTTVKLTTDSDWLKQEVRGIRQDLRDQDRGRPLAPLPTPHPSPTRTP